MSSRRLFSTFSPNYGKIKLKKEYGGTIPRGNIDKALEHFDDLYASVFNRKWPSLRLGLLSEQKYIAIPNGFTGKGDEISEELKAVGAYDMKELWTHGQNKLRLHRQELYSKREAERLQELEQTLHSIANTKVAEELESLYQNAPLKKIPIRTGEVLQQDRRILKDIRDATAEFVTPTKLKGVEHFQFESEYFSFYAEPGNTTSGLQNQPNPNDLPNQNSVFKFTDPNTYSRISFPYLRPHTFEAGNPTAFAPANRDVETGLRKYLCINGASLAPVMALDLAPDSKLLDLCAGPGIKSLLCLMTMCPQTITCNDLETSRLLRVKQLFQEFTGFKEPSSVTYTKINATNYPPSEDYDRVLVDVPCSSDRVSVTSSDNSIFKHTRTKERLNLVQVQKKILMSAFKSLSKDPGSCAVYSTCTLSPIENDGAVAAALQETDIPNLQVDLMGLWDVLMPLKIVQQFHFSRTKFGVLIEPNVFSNFGPMYISRIVVGPETTPHENANIE